MIRCKKSDNPYLVFASFVFDFLELLAAGEFRKAQKMFDEDHHNEFWGRVVELGIDEMETDFTLPINIPSFEIRFYCPAFDLGNDYSIEFSIPNTEMEYETKIEFKRVKGGFKTILVSL